MKVAKKIVSLVLAIVMGLSCFTLFSFAEETSNTEHLTEVPEGYVGIYTKTDLDNIKLDMAGKYILMNDIVFEDSDYEKGGDFYNSGKGWEPIGTTTLKFKGVLDGNGYTIKNLYINNPNADYIGLFGYAVNATIMNLVLKNVDITGKDYVGAIAGSLFEESTVSDCIVEGKVSGVTCVGGFCGCQDASTNNGTDFSNIIKKSINLSTVTGSEYVGGFSGKMISSYKTYDYQRDAYGKISRIASCINNGNIVSTSSYAGGIAGYASGAYFSYRETYFGSTISCCYNTGSVSGSWYYGGILGSLDKSFVKHCYSIGEIKDSDSKSYGGISTVANSLYVTDCYYLDTSVTENTYAGTPKSEDQLRKQTTFEQWDFDTVWTMQGREHYLYPELLDTPLVFENDINHEHEYSSKITTPATHTSEGVRTYTCECGDSYTEPVAKLEGHNYTSTVTKEPTHLEEGVRTYTCECGDSYTDTINKIADHSYKAVVTPPTCEDKGYTTYTCECGDTYVADYVDETGHSHKSTITTPATHTSTGVMTFTCHCGDTYTKAIEKTAEHNHKAVVTKPTCEDKGFTTYTCECGDSYVTDYKGATGHDYDSGIVTSKPTCTKAGVRTFTCANCGDTYTEAIKALGHNHKSTITTPATHLKEGVVTFTCACGDSYAKPIAKIEEHSYTAVVTDPTCSEKGYTTYTCECGDSYVADYVDATAHNDSDNDGNCDDCEKHLCDHMCHKSGVAGFFWKIINFFCKLFGANKFCECGKAHY